MVVHNIQVKFTNVTLPMWRVSDEFSFYFGLYSNILEHLKTPSTDPNTRLGITATIRGGEMVLDIDSDASLMRMFAVNTNPDDIIVLDVKEIIERPLQVIVPQGEKEQEARQQQEFEQGREAEQTNQPNEEEQYSSSEDHDDDPDSDDPDWAGGASDNISSESTGDYLTTSDDETHKGEDTVILSDDEYDESFRRPHRDGEPRHPNSNVPRVPNPIEDGRRIVLMQWQVFNDFKCFMAVLKDFCIQEGFELKRIKYERTRATFVCKVEGCPWRIHASLSPDKLSFMVKTFNNNHTCTQVRNNTLATSAWLAEHLLDSFKIHPDMDIHAMRAEIKTRFGLDIDNRRLWRARAKAKQMLEGSYVESFRMLRVYAAMVLQTNPRSSAIICSELEGNAENSNVEPPRFKRIFICYEGVRHGFIAGCRPFYGLDGCHLKGPYKGVLLAAVGVDGNLQFFPIAYAIVETENKETWEWFITLLKEAIGETNYGEPWTIMSDRQKGIIDATPIMSNSRHRYCAFHLKNNFRKLWGDDELKNLFWKASRTANFNEFQHTMRAIKDQNRAAFEWLSLIDPKHWSRSKFDHHANVEHVTNNFVESFNDWLDGLRSKPPISLLEGIRLLQSDLMYARQATAGRWDQVLTPKVMGRIKELRKKSRYAVVRRVGANEFQVDHDMATYPVKLDEKYCVCEQWQVRGIPCLHALACIDTIRADVAEYTSVFFTTEMWKKSYAGCIHPIPSNTMWPPMEGMDLRPPKAHKLPGRPKMSRRRSTDESRPTGQPARKKCRVCGEYGHNRTTCAQTIDASTTSTSSNPLLGRKRSRGSRQSCSTSHQENQDQLGQTQPDDLFPPTQ